MINETQTATKAQKHARLIAAAPEMLHMLIELDRYFNRKSWTAKGKWAQRLGRMVEATIKKAQ